MGKCCVCRHIVGSTSEPISACLLWVFEFYLIYCVLTVAAFHINLSKLSSVDSPFALSSDVNIYVISKWSASQGDVCTVCCYQPCVCLIPFSNSEKLKMKILTSDTHTHTHTLIVFLIAVCVCVNSVLSRSRNASLHLKINQTGIYDTVALLSSQQSLPGVEHSSWRVSGHAHTRTHTHTQSSEWS